jgi:pyruvoyl-dependent arginine decarboxylase (PvlArgDC)
MSYTKQHTIKKKREMVAALVKSLGIVTIACKEVGIERSTHYDWIKDDEEYKKQVEDIGDVAIDFAESMLHKQIQDRDTTATIFYLKTKGKKRGYIEKFEMEHSGGIILKFDGEDAKA